VTIAGTALSPLESIGIVLIFVVFILLQREDLRNHFIRLVGSDDLQRTTLAMNDAAGRLSRFFLIQTLVNASFGIIVAFGLYFIGIPSPILWGITAFLLRFIPYIGPFIAAVFPIALAAAVDPGWGNGTRCGLPTFMRSSGMVHSRAPKSISLHWASNVSLVRVAVRIRNSRARAAIAERRRSSAMKPPIST
jgi:AI-2E family transporter